MRTTLMTALLTAGLATGVHAQGMAPTTPPPGPATTTPGPQTTTQVPTTTRPGSPESATTGVPDPTPSASDTPTATPTPTPTADPVAPGPDGNRDAAPLPRNRPQ